MPIGDDGPEVAEIEARLRLALARIDRPLGEAELAQVRGKTRHLVALAAALREVRLEHGEAPAPPFAPAVASGTASFRGGDRDQALHARSLTSVREAPDGHC